MKKEFEEFLGLYNQDSSVEEDFQKFLEHNTCLIPRQFVQHHGIELNVVYVKVSLGNDYISDFMFVTKSSADWTCVHIEIENPKKPIFKEKGGFSALYNDARTQVKNWEVWFKKSENKSSFENSIKIALRSNMRDNPINHKFILIYGRDSEIDCEQKKRLWSGEKNIDAMTWDSLFEGTHGILNLAKFTNQKVHFIDCPTPLRGDLFVSGLNPADFEMPQETIEKMKQTLLQEQENDKNNPITDNEFFFKRINNIIECVSKIKTYKKK